MTWRSCIASSSALCVFGVARLISSASRMFVKHRALLDAEGRGLRVVDAGAEDVGGQQVRRELHALELRRDRLRQRRRRQRLGHARHAFEQQVAAAGSARAFDTANGIAAKRRRQHPPDQRVLSDDDLADLVLETGDDFPAAWAFNACCSLRCIR